MSVDLAARANLLGVLEHRAIAHPFEFRKDAATGQLIFEGYAATFDAYDCYGGPTRGGWVEQLSRSAFSGTLAASPDVMLLINHAELPLARTKSGTLKLRTDSHGLFARALLEPTDPDVMRIAPKMHRRDLDEMSFGFRVNDQIWDEGYTKRTITDLNLDLGDVSIVNHGMNSNTAAMLSSGIEALASLSHKELVELRSQLDPARINRAIAVLQRAKDTGGDAAYADAGYKADGKKRYPIDTEEHARAAWSYINQARNQKGYTAEQVSSIRGRIKGALKKFGVEVSDDSDSKAAGVEYIDIVRNRDGGQTLVAVLADGSRVPLPSQKTPMSIPTAGVARATSPIDPTPPFDPNAGPIDPHDEDYDKSDLGELDPGELHGDPAPTPSPQAGSGFRSKEADMDDDKKKKDQDEDERATSSRPGGKLGGGHDDDDEDDRAGHDAACDGKHEADDPCNDKDKEGRIDMGLAAALEATIVSCYQLAEANPELSELRQMLTRARRQLAEMRGKTLGNTGVNRRLAELRDMTGAPDTGTVSDCLNYLRSEGVAPLGYQGLWREDHDYESRATQLVETAEAKGKAAAEQFAADARQRRIDAAAAVA